MTMPVDPVPFSWRVVGFTANEYGPGPSGADVLGRMVHFQLGDGTVDDVFIPNSQWGTEQATTMISRAARTAYDILTANSGSATPAS